MPKTTVTKPPATSVASKAQRKAKAPATTVGAAEETSFEVDIRPDAAALRMFRSLSFTPWYALGEFVDNSISSYFHMRKALEAEHGADFSCDVRISFADRVGRLVVEDNAGGIAPADIRRALKTGEPPPESEVGLNLHGVGMKAASFWWGRHLTIESWPLGEAEGWTVEIDLGEAGTQPQATAAVRSIPWRGHSGTKITVDGLWQNTPVASKTRSTVAAYLPSIYRKFISIAEADGPLGAGGHPVRLFLDGTQLSFEPPKLLEEPYWPNGDGPEKGADPVTWRKDIRVDLSTGRSVSGWVGILEVMSRELSGFTLHYRGKGIGGVTPLNSTKDGNSGFRPRAIFGQAGSYRAQSYIGEFDVTALGKSITTDSTMWTPDEEEEFVDHVLEQMKDDDRDLWSMAVNFKRRRRNKVDTSNLEKVSSAAAMQLSGAVTGNISHDDPADEPTEPQVEDDTPEHRFTITDREVHTHSFGLRFTTARSARFIAVGEDAARRNHTIVVNEGHPLFDDLPPIDVNTRALLTRLSLALAAAEVFVESPDRHAVRAKMNEILDLVHPEPADLEDTV